MWVCGILRLASDVLPVVIRRGAEPEDGDSVEPLAVLHELVQGPHALRDDHIAFVEPGDLRKNRIVKLINQYGKKATRPFLIFCLLQTLSAPY